MMVPEVRTLSSLLGLALLWFPLDSDAGAGPGMFCLFNGKRYSPGESWHPYLEPQGLMYCLRCTCSETAHVNCYRLRCPPIHCPHPVTEPQQCCPRCVEPHTPSGLQAPPKSCQHNGTTYQHGEIFGARELFPSRLPNQCVLCSCTEGQIYCGLMTCPEPGCPAPFPLPDSCCQTCKACVHSGRTYSHGDVWHPALRSFGPLPCILCTCQDGRLDCQRMICPSEYPCQHPEKVEGKCCKICPEDRADPDHSEIRSTRCPKVPAQVFVHTAVSPSPDSLHRFALEHEASDQVEIYLWKLVKGIFHLIQIKRVQKQDFQKEAQNFRLLTGTHEGHWNVFLAQTSELKVTASPDKVTKTL